MLYSIYASLELYINNFSKVNTIKPINITTNTGENVSNINLTQFFHNSIDASSGHSPDACTYPPISAILYINLLFPIGTDTSLSFLHLLEVLCRSTAASEMSPTELDALSNGDPICSSSISFIPLGVPVEPYDRNEMQIIVDGNEGVLQEV